MRSFCRTHSYTQSSAPFVNSFLRNKCFTCNSISTTPCFSQREQKLNYSNKFNSTVCYCKVEEQGNALATASIKLIEFVNIFTNKIKLFTEVETLQNKMYTKMGQY